jgi:hypothetical protein
LQPIQLNARNVSIIRIIFAAMLALVAQDCQTARPPRPSFAGSYRGGSASEALQVCQIGLTFGESSYSGSQKIGDGEEIVIEGEYAIETERVVRFIPKKNAAQENVMDGKFSFILVGKTLTLENKARSLKLYLERLPER